jgi:hypothetical protein
MLENCSYLFTIVLAFSAIFCPVFTALINNCHQREVNKQNNELQVKLRRLDFYYTYKDKAINEYLNALCEYLNNQNSQNFNKYLAAHSKAFMYLSSEACNAIDGINILVKGKHFEQALNLLTSEFAHGLYVENAENRVDSK